jgi:hypothetical protein
MSIIGIDIPQLNEEQDIEVEVRVNGIKKQYNYRVEIFYWDQCDAPADDRVACIRSMVNGYASEWDLTHLGMPTDDYIPITFRKKRVR